MAAVGHLIRLHHSALLFGNRVHYIIDGGFAFADECYVAGPPPNIAAVVIDIRGNFPGGKGRVSRVICGAE